MNGKGKVELHNKFSFQLTDSAGNVKQVGYAENVVVNRYYSELPDHIKDGPVDRGISLGTGTGTPAVTDTALFNYLTRKATGAYSSVTPLGNGQYSWTATTTFTENEANDNLTEVGLCDYYGYIFTHAMITDSEGHTIAIQKTTSDRLTVTATLYLTLTFDNNLKYLDKLVYHERYPSIIAAEANPERITHRDNCTNLIRYCAGLSTTDSSFYILLAKGASEGWLVGSDYSYDSTTQTKRYRRARIQSTEYNMNQTYQIFGIRNAYGIKSFPDHTVFPPITLELEKTANGNSGDFNFGIPILMDDVTVFVDGVQQPSAAYVWGGKDFSFRQAWESQHGDHLVKATEVVYDYDYSPASAPVCGHIYNGYSRTNPKGSHYVVYYDFETPKAVNHLRHLYDSGYCGCSLYYSNDNENWTLAAEVNSGDTDRVYDRSFETITARYWKSDFGTNVPFKYSWAEMQTRFIGAFDFFQPQLHLNTVPAAGSVVKIVAKSEYPIKNSNWIIDQMLIDMKITGGNS